MKNKELISIVIPVYGNKKLVQMLYDRLLTSLSMLDVDFEIIMVNDACPYGSGDEIEKLAEQDKRVKLIDLARNFGQHYAIKAGLDHAQGDWAVVMDCDLQDKPEDIIELYNKAQHGYECVFAARGTRKDTFLKKLFSRTFKIFNNVISEVKYEDNIGNYSIISRKVISEYKKIKEVNFNYNSMILWLGFKTAYINVEKTERETGSSSYTAKKMIRLAISSIVSQTNKPLIFSTYCSFFLFILCFIGVIRLFTNYYFLGVPLLGWTSIMVSIFFIGGLLFAYLSILGLYIGSIFKEVKKRPLYIIGKTKNVDTDCFIKRSGRS